MSYWPDVEEELGMPLTATKVDIGLDNNPMKSVVIDKLHIKYGLGIMNIRYPSPLGDKILTFNMEELKGFEIDKSLTIGLSTGTHTFPIAMMGNDQRLELDAVLTTALALTNLTPKPIELDLGRV